MGLAIEYDEKAPIPRPTKLVLTCDAHDSLFPPARAEFRGPDGYIAQHAAAMQAGWLERIDPERGRIFLCPDCSRK